MTHYEPKSESIKREIQVLKIIEDNPNLNHNSVMDIAVNRQKIMAKATFEKCIKSLIEKNVLIVKQEANKKHYFLKENFEHVHQVRMERGVEILFHSVKKAIPHLKERYPHLSIDEKSQKVFEIISDCLTISEGFIVIGSIKNPKKIIYKDEQIDLQNMINEVFQMIKSDKDFNHVYKVVASYLLPSLSEDYQNLEKI